MISLIIFDEQSTNMFDCYFFKTHIDRHVGTMQSLSGADQSTYVEIKKKPTDNGHKRLNKKPKHELFKKYR
jgi:hypothetical protein